ncbi:unnamed protein product [Moneuplotes crassus]|uniref:Uncharacterized protein n=1 Tax=Euplotes crassus TaxID=5936 RepID=A0AAD1X4B2_EUPCR|nr:unnamed protein product [Moneuplotes crassus]
MEDPSDTNSQHEFSPIKQEAQFTWNNDESLQSSGSEEAGSQNPEDISKLRAQNSSLVKGSPNGRNSKLFDYGGLQNAQQDLDPFGQGKDVIAMDSEPQGDRTQELTQLEELDFSNQLDNKDFFRPKLKEVSALRTICDFVKASTSSDSIEISKKNHSYSVDKPTLWGINSKISDHECDVFLKQNFKHIPWVSPSIVGVSSPKLQLHNEIVEFYKVFGPNPKEMHNRAECFKAVKKAIKRYIKSRPEINSKDIKVRVFGSSCTNLYVNSTVKRYYKLIPSDIDIVVSGSIQLMDIHNALEACPERFGDCHPLKAKVSLIKGYDHHTNIDFDICINESDGVKGSKLVNQFKKEFPELKYLAVILKILLSIHDLNKTFDGGISSFGLILLIVSYLQQHKNRKAQQEDASPTLLSEHLLNLLKLYGVDFNYKKLGISVRKAGFYYNRNDKGFDNGSHARSALSLENPINTDLNIAVAAHRFPEIMKLFRECHSKITLQEHPVGLSILGLILQAS